MVADVFSRIESIITTINYHDLEKEQEKDSELSELIRNSTALKLKKIASHEANIYCDLSTARPRPYITLTFRFQAFDSLHSLSHPGPSASSKLVAQKFVWPEFAAIAGIGQSRASIASAVRSPGIHTRLSKNSLLLQIVFLISIWT